MQDKVIKYFEKQTQYEEKEGNNIGIVVDTETTSLDEDAEIIELCILPFSFTDDMEICKVFKPYVGFEEPKKPLSDETKVLTNLTDEELVGKVFDDGSILSLFNKAEVPIAHNAGFDAKKIAKRFPMMKKLPWACSINDINWKEEYITSRTLDYLMFKYGYWFEHHRAENDCRATLHVLAQKRSDGTTNFQHMMKSVFTPKIRMVAKDTPFETKDKWKAAGYRWDGQSKGWFKEINEDLAHDTETEMIRIYFDVDIVKEPININKRYL